MPSLDLFTLSCVTIVNLLMTSAAMYFVSRVNRQTTGIVDCAAGGFVLASAFILSAVRAMYPSSALNIIANLLLLGGTIVLLEGIREFRGMKRIRPTVTLGGLALFAALYALWLFEFNSIRNRTILASFAVSFLMYACAWAMGSDTDHRDRSVHWATASVYALQATVLLLRGILAFRVIPESSIFSGRTIDLLNVITVNFSCMGSAFGLALATNLKLTRESEKLAQFDALTNLPNRRYFEERLEQAERRAITAGGNLAVIYCDLDGFKQFNDTLGHEAGDEVLRVVAGRLRQTMQENMCLARVGGDEFLVLVEKPGRPEETLSLVRAMRTAVGQEMEVAGTKLTPKISCGMALYPEDVSSAADMVRLADSAMYAMKQQARSADPENPLGWRSAAPRLAAD